MRKQIINCLLFVVALSCGCDEINGLQSLINTSDETPGANCPYGGLKIDSGIDRNSNGTLEGSEIDNTNYVCDGQPNLDRMTTMTFGTSVYVDTSTWTIIESAGTNLYNFNIDDYPNVDSVIFMMFLGTNAADNTCSVELYNVTDNVAIENSELQSNFVITAPKYYEMKRSSNIVNNLPHKPVTLTFRIKSETDGTGVATGFRSFLYLYRH